MPAHLTPGALTTSASSDGDGVLFNWWRRWDYCGYCTASVEVRLTRTNFWHTTLQL